MIFPERQSFRYTFQHKTVLKDSAGLPERSGLVNVGHRDFKWMLPGQSGSDKIWAVRDRDGKQWQRGFEKKKRFHLFERAFKKASSDATWYI